MTILTELEAARTSARTKLRSKVSALGTVLTGEAAIDPASLARKVITVEQFWTAFDNAHESYFSKLNPKDEQLEAETEYWTTEDTATEEVLEQARAQLDIANAPVAEEPPPPPDNTASIQILKAELEERKEIANDTIT